MSPLAPLRIGLIINPVSGIGGPAGLGGSDGTAIQAEAMLRGSSPQAEKKAQRLLTALTSRGAYVEILTARGAMGEDAVRAAGLEPARVLSWPDYGRITTAEDTKRIACELESLLVDVIVFVGGDGTARNVRSGTSEQTVMLGVPAGVKMQSAVFARSPEAAAGIIATASVDSYHLAEIVDIDEEARRAGNLRSQLYGQARVLGHATQTQGGKLGSTLVSGEQIGGIAAEVANRIASDAVVLFAPGTTVSRVSESLGYASTLLGVDATLGGETIGQNCSAEELLRLTEGRRVQLVVSPVGGQGFILGRGNQQLDGRVLSRVRPEDLLIVGTAAKIGSLAGGTLWIDVEDSTQSQRFVGPRRVIMGRNHEAVLNVAQA